MKIAYFWTWQNWALLFGNMAAEGAVLYFAAKRGFFRRLVMLPAFSLFCLLADVAAIVLGFTLKAESSAGPLYTSHAYWVFYFAEQLTAGVIILLLALQIVTAILPPWDRLLALLGILACAGLAVAYLKLLPGDVLRALVIADVVAILALPIIAVVSPQEWPKGLSMVTAGLIASCVMQAACGLLAGYLKTLAGVFNLGVPLAALIGMLFFIAGIHEQKKDSGVPSAA